MQFKRIDNPIMRALVIKMVQNEGKKGAKEIQESIVALGKTIKVDGAIGKISMGAINAVSNEALADMIINRTKPNGITPKLKNGKYSLGSRSLRELKGVHPDIVRVVMRAIEISTQNFMVLDGLRTKKEQRKLVARGVSKTMRSYHLFGLAVDLVAIDSKGKPSWNKKLYPAISIAVKKAMEELNLPILDNGFEMWGWDNPHWQLKKMASNHYNPRKFYAAKKGKGF